LLCSEKDRPDARDFGNWDRKGPLADIPGQRKPSDRSNFGGERSGGGFGGRNFDNASDAGGERPNRRPAYEQADGKVRDLGNWERKGPLTPTLPASIPAINRPVSRDGPRERRNSPAWGEGTNRSQEGSRPPRKEFVERPIADRAPTAPELDNKWRSKMRPDPPAPAPVPALAASPTPSNKELSVPSSPAAPATAAAGPPSSRPKLNLQKRTVSQAEPSPALPTGVSDAKASPFGAARPIDTTAREQEVLARKEREAKEKKEAEDKAREEKKAADDKAKEERRLAKEAERAEKAAATKDNVNGEVKESENGAETPGKNYQILRRATNDDTSADNEHADENANGYVTEDKAVKPQDITRDIPIRKANGVDAKPAEGSASPSVDALEEDGWSTVSKPQKPRKNGNQSRQPSRAIAS
jgi:translation initiation factor 4B